MGHRPRGTSRRSFLAATAAFAGVSAVPTVGRATPKYVRYNATSKEGAAMLESYATAIKRMLALDPRDGRNWFRNAFIHTLDCPHMNWWFFVWHRPYLGYFEQTVRELGGNPEFAMPYWDWSATGGEQPGYCIPKPMLEGILTPIDQAYNQYISSFDTFYNYLNPALEAFWSGLSNEQLSALDVRGMPTLASVWDQAKATMFATTPYARYLKTGNACLDDDTQVAVSKETVDGGLSAPSFTDFNSGETDQHSQMAPRNPLIGVLESQPHNLTHNNIGGVNHVPNSQLGFMQDNLSPVDPIFFLHHSNMDRLWDVWTRKQQSCRLPYLRRGASWDKYAREKFMFYVNSKGQPVTQVEAGSYVSMAQFGYTYQPGTGEDMIGKCPIQVAARAVKGTVKNGVAALAASPRALLEKSNAVIAKVTIPYPSSPSAPRSFAVLVNAPGGNTDTSAKSPYFAGSIAFFGFSPKMAGMPATFSVPIDRALRSAQAANAKTLTIQVVPRSAPGTALLRGAPATKLQAASVTVW